MQKEKRSRILTLDLLRGAFLVAIIADHLPWGPSLFHLVTGGGVMFASPAEGFFVISGVLVGYIYGPRLKTSFMSAARKLWKRAGLLWALSIVGTFLFTAISVSFPSVTGLPEVWSRSGESFLLNTLLGRYAYGWADFLPRYAVFMLIAPFVLWLISRGKAWLVVSGSALVYLLFSKTALLLPFSAWEVIFIPSIVIGYYLPSIEAAAKRLPRMIARPSASFLMISALVTFIASEVIFVLLPMLGIESTLITSFTTHFASLFDKETLGVGRLVLGTLWFSALYLFVRRHEVVINGRTGRVLETFGTKSLYTYCIHAIVVYLLVFITPMQVPFSVLDSTVLTAMTLVGMYILVRSPALSGLTNFATYTAFVRRLIPYNRRYEYS